MKAQSGDVVSFVCVSLTTILGQGRPRTLKLEEQITLMFDELRWARLSHLLCLSASPTEADEIIQETFLRLIGTSTLG